ncbi:MAG: DUF4386 domain-containing protein [Bacteroidia bacterium]
MNPGNKSVETSPNVYARIGGMLYLVIILAGMFSVIVVRDKMIVSGDAAATANNIMASPLLWRFGIACDLLMHLCDIPVMWVVYLLLRPVNKNLALLALLFNLIQTAVLVTNKLNLLTPLFLLSNADYLKAFNPQQLHSMIYLSVKAHDYGFGVALLFFGLVCIVNGYLIIKSDYLPKLIGVMLQIAGVCYLISNFSLILAPSFSNKLFPVLMIPVLIAETSFCFWLIIKGVNITKWNERVLAGRD